jgi:integrase
MNEEYTSALAGHITGLICQKQSVGYKYQTEAAILKRFDTFCNTYYPATQTLDRDIVFHWSRQRTGEHPATLQGRITPVRELARYMIRNGLWAFILPEGMLPKVPRYLPYIYSDDEIKRIFSHIDRCHCCVEVPYRHYVMPLFFRLLYCCGLRVSEARMIKVGDVDLEQGVITLTHTKSGKHRQVPLSIRLHEKFIAYYQRIHTCSTPDDWFFPGYKNKPMTVGNVEKNHRKFLWQAGISHPGRVRPGERGAPCVHSYRHTCAVHCLRNWIREGKNVQACMPVLQAYMGHASYSGTAYYLHLTVDMFPDITNRLENEMNRIIPSITTTNYDIYEENY